MLERCFICNYIQNRMGGGEDASSPKGGGAETMSCPNMGRCLPSTLLSGKGKKTC